MIPLIWNSRTYSAVNQITVCFLGGKESWLGRSKRKCSSKIKISSRSETRVSGLYDDINLDLFISTCNRILNEYRIKTEDAFMAPFKNLRKDMKYRRRLDFATAKLIISKAVEELTNASYKEHNKVSNDIKYQAIDLFNL